MEVPAQVKEAAKDLVDLYGDTFDYLGKYEGAEAYMYHFPDDSCTGYPFVCLVKNGKVEVVTDSPALYIVGLLVENIDESDVE